MTKKSSKPPVSYVVKRENLEPKGEIRFPAIDNVNGLMMQRMEAIESTHPFPEAKEGEKSPSSYEVVRARAFQAGEFIREGHLGAGWDLTLEVEDKETGDIKRVPFEINQFMSWKHKPDLEKVNFVTWLSQAYRMYMRDVFDPNFKPGS